METVLGKVKYAANPKAPDFAQLPNEVDAEICQGLAVHKMPKGFAWTVTHRRTGKSLAHALFRENALWAMEEYLKASDFEFESAKEIPVEKRKELSALKEKIKLEIWHREDTDEITL